MGYRKGWDEMEKLIRDEVESLGYRYWGRELHHYGRRSLLRVYIDNEPAITLDDCARVSERLSGSLDASDFIAGSYNLEVSSPGVERRLFNPDHYRSYLGHRVKVRCFTAVQGRKNIVGSLDEVLDDNMNVSADDKVYTIPYANIRRVRLVCEELASRT